MGIKSVQDAENAVKENPYRFINIDKPFQTRTVCEIAVSAKGTLLKHVPFEHRDIELCLKALDSCNQSRVSNNCENITQHIPTEIRDKVVAEYKLNRI